MISSFPRRLLNLICCSSLTFWLGKNGDDVVYPNFTNLFYRLIRKRPGKVHSSNFGADIFFQWADFNIYLHLLVFTELIVNLIWRFIRLD